MASVTLTGTLLDPTGEVAVGDQIRFTHRTTTGETIQFARSVLIIPPSGMYNITLEFGLIFVEYLDVKDVKYKSLGVVTVNGSTTATDLPGLLNAIVPPTDAQLLLFQAILADTEDARDIAVAAAAQQTTLELIFSVVIHPAGTVLTISGFTISGDGGGAQWKLNGVVGQPVSQSPAQLGDALLNDASGNQWALITSDESVNTRLLGSVSDLVADDELVIIATNKFATDNDVELIIDNCATTVKLSLSSSASGNLKFTGSAINDHIVEYDTITNKEVSKLDIDGNNVNNGTKGLISLKDCINVNVIDGVYINAVGIGISVVGGSDIDILRNTLTKNTPTGAVVNIGINVSDATTIPQNINIKGNKVTGFAIQVRGKGCTIFNNKVSNWQFGSGITMTPPANIGLEDSYGNHKVLANEIHDSSGIDVDVTAPSGIECSQSRCELALNTIFNCAGEGIISASKFAKIHNNDCYDNGSELTASTGSRDGIHLRTLTASSGTDSNVNNNKCYDTRSGASRTQLFGIRVNDDIDRASIICNTLENNLSGDYVLPAAKVFKLVSNNGAVNNFGGNLSIAAGVIIVEFGSYQIDTEASAATDDLVTIDSNEINGEILILGLVSAARVVTVKNATGNIRTKTGADVVLTSQFQIITLYFRNGTWIEI